MYIYIHISYFVEGESILQPGNYSSIKRIDIYSLYCK